MLLPLIWAGDFSLGDKALVIYLLLYISSVCGSVIMISVHHTTVTWLLLVGARILFVTVCASWRNTVEGDPDGYTFAGIVVVVSIVLLLDIDWRMWLQSVEDYAMK